jgi:hypothetical protein
MTGPRDKPDGHWRKTALSSPMSMMITIYEARRMLRS